VLHERPRQDRVFIWTRATLGRSKAQGDRDCRQVSIWREFCQSQCKQFINLFPVFFAAADTDKQWYEHLYILGDDHFSAAGNRFLFMELARHLL